MSPLHLIEYLYHSAVCNHEIDLNLNLKLYSNFNYFYIPRSSQFFI